ncbi:MAG: NADH-quinone oxidoreductase subunit L [Candidatus Omnitrophica bacterium]|nr:NADH-quinone oxidoreductase subunit L [Candidatus Omnitrophota bacterium]
MEHATTRLIVAPLLAWIPLLPLTAFTVLILVGRRLRQYSAWLAIAALAGAGGVTLGIAEPVWHGYRLGLSWPWVLGSRWALGLVVDGLSWLMLLVVTGVGTMIAVYSIGYMHDDPRFSRFFAYFSLFCASMLTLVLADSLVLLYAGWELVGLCSYLLISFWFEKPAAAEAGRKAFLTTRVGDTGLFLGILVLAWTTGEMHFARFPALARQLPPELLTTISVLIFFGAVGKSAQFPLHVWLPDAMEGPTPVSALIHAATMVAAGVYLVARSLPLFTPTSLNIVLAVGLITHVFAGTVALTMTDIKRVLAYSTLSQLGLMMTALGLGAATLAMFHLTTHAFFKALLFLAAGSVIHATHQQELESLGGLRRLMPWTAAVFLLAALSMSGFFPLSGFWSKDAILLHAQHERPWVFALLILGAGMTAGYVFRLYLRCFHGAEAHANHPKKGHVQHEHPAHESPGIMVLPMTVLAIGAAFAGFAGSPWLGHPFFHLLGVSDAHEGIDPAMLIGSTVAAGMGIWLAWVVGVKRHNLLPEALRPLGTRLYTLAVNKYYVDETYQRFIIQPFLGIGRGLSQFDRQVIDAAVDGTGRAGGAIARLKAWIDRTIVDGAVNAIAFIVRGCGGLFRGLQTGIIQQYLLVVIVAVVALSIALRRG